MLYHKKGFPQENDIVLCRVTKIFPSSVFVQLLEYGESGIVHISEVSPGRIRNLRDYVSVGRQIVCKVLRVDKERGHIDLSLRRVNSNQRREKIDDIKQELKAEQLLKNLSKKLGMELPKLYKTVSEKLFKDYEYINLGFQDVVSDDLDLEKIGLDKKIATELTNAILDKFKPSKITIEGEITVSTYHSDGVNRIKEVLAKVEKVSPTISLAYLGAGRFKLIIEDEDYKPAEVTLKKVQQTLEVFDDKVSTAAFVRDKQD